MVPFPDDKMCGGGGGEEEGLEGRRTMGRPIGQPGPGSASHSWLNRANGGTCEAKRKQKRRVGGGRGREGGGLPAQNPSRRDGRPGASGKGGRGGYGSVGPSAAEPGLGHIPAGVLLPWGPLRQWPGRAALLLRGVRANHQARGAACQGSRGSAG